MKADSENGSRGGSRLEPWIDPGSVPLADPDLNQWVDLGVEPGQIQRQMAGQIYVDFKADAALDSLGEPKV